MSVIWSLDRKKKDDRTARTGKRSQHAPPTPQGWGREITKLGNNQSWRTKHKLSWSERGLSCRAFFFLSNYDIKSCATQMDSSKKIDCSGKFWSLSPHYFHFLFWFQRHSAAISFFPSLSANLALLSSTTSSERLLTKLVNLGEPDGT